MTTTTPETVAIPTDLPRRPSARLRFGVAFLIGLLLALLAGAGALYAYDQQYVGRILPGVRVGAVDLSGMDPAAATTSLEQAFAGATDGQLVLAGPDGDITIPYTEVGRKVDVDGLVQDALAIGRAGNPIERVVADARTALRGVTIDPRVTFDADAVAALIDDQVAALARDPEEASVFRNEAGRFQIEPGSAGRRGDSTPAIAAALAALGRLDAPATLRLDIPIEPVDPVVTTVEAFRAKDLADRLTARIELAVEDLDEPVAVTTTKLREWTTFSIQPDGSYVPTVDTSLLPALVERLARDIDQAPVNASFKTSGGRITGVTPSKNGYKVDVAATVGGLQTVLADRAAGAVIRDVEPTLQVTRPVLTTAEAEDVRPKMRRISRWTTYFPVSEKNGFGANIWIPARLIDGYVVAPGATFDFWEAVGPVTREKGYRDGGAIINGRTEPQGALAGGICSCSTTLFNAALRAGYEMGARRNHYYYIDRYPLGLDATVFKSGSGSTQTMSFTNDTRYPILIRGYGWKEGSSGYVRFDLYSVPTGRKVSFSKPVVKNVRQASDTVQYTSSLAPGVSKRLEYPVDGKQVWVTRTVRDRSGTVIHKETYYSNYARITGVTLIGKGAAPADDTAGD